MSTESNIVEHYRAAELLATIEARIFALGKTTGLHVIIGSAAPDKLANLIEAITRGTLAPVEISCRAS